MKYLFLLLVLTGCTAPKAEAEQENQALNLPSYAASQSQAAVDREPLGGEALEAQITEDFKPYLKYFSGEKLYPYTVIKNGEWDTSWRDDIPAQIKYIVFENQGCFISYTNSYGVQFFEEDKLLLSDEEFLSLPDADLGYHTLYKALRDDFENLYVSPEHFKDEYLSFLLLFTNEGGIIRDDFPHPYKYSGKPTLQDIFYWFWLMNSDLLWVSANNLHVEDRVHSKTLSDLKSLRDNTVEKALIQIKVISLVLPIDNPQKLKNVLMHMSIEMPNVTADHKILIRAKTPPH